MKGSSSMGESEVRERGRPMPHGEELSLVDVVAIACRQWKVAVIVFLILLFLVALAAFQKDEEYAYSSVYQVAQKQSTESNPLGAFEQPSAVAEKISSLYTGSSSRSLLEEWGEERLGFSVDVSNPPDTLLVVLTSEINEEESNKVKELHRRSLQAALEAQKSDLQGRQESLQQRRSDLRQRLDSLPDGDASGELAVVYANQLQNIDAKLSELSQGSVVQLAERSVEPVGLGRVWVLLLGGIVSMLIALVSTWVAHFLRLVARALREDDGKN